MRLKRDGEGEREDSNNKRQHKQTLRAPGLHIAERISKRCPEQQQFYFRGPSVDFHGAPLGPDRAVHCEASRPATAIVSDTSILLNMILELCRLIHYTEAP